MITAHSASQPPRLGHTAMSAGDPARLAEFYRDLLGLRIVRRVSNPLGGDGSC
jgi:catechol 2,3-dioxygenase-like lactoylglutathione lyase family enzyme